MTRFAALAGLTLAIAACTREPEPGSVPESILLVSDSLGNLPGAGILSPDGSKLAFSRTVAGKAAIFVANADGTSQKQLTHGVWDSNPIWSPDGKWIAYHAESPDFDIMVIPVEGGEPRRLTSGSAVDQPRNWLPDGSAVIFGRTGDGDDQTLVVPLEGGTPRRLAAEVKGNQHANISPDGSMVGYDVHQGGGDATVWVQDSLGAPPRQLTTENFENINAAYLWSPDSKYIAYISRRTGTQDLWIVDVKTGEQRQLTNDVRDDNTPRWSPDGTWMAFISDRGGQTDLWMMPVAGGKAIRLTSDRATEINPRWTPDGQALTYGRVESTSEILVQPAAGGEPRVVMSLPTGYIINGGDVSPDGKTVVYSSDRSGNFDIWTVSVAGGEPVVFSASPSLDVEPKYSTRGNRVVFRSNRGGSMDLWMAPATGGEARQLTRDAAIESSPSWSPDETRVAYASNRGTGGGDLWVVDSAGGEPKRLTQNGLRPNSVQWSRDGQHIFFIGGGPGGTSELYRIPASGGTPQALGAKPGIRTALLSPDGSQVGYASFEGGWAFIDVIPAAGGVPRRLTAPVENVFQPIFAWAPDGQSLAVSDLDFEGNHDNADLFLVRLSDGGATRLTRTLMQSEFPAKVLADGGIVTIRVTSRAVAGLRTPQE
jgi:Tol biopolymer transport system component